MVTRAAKLGPLSRLGRRALPRDPGLHPPDRGDDPDQLVIGQPGQASAVVTGDGVHDGGEQRAGGQIGGGPGLGEPVSVQFCGGHAEEQALLPGLGQEEPSGSSPSWPGSENGFGRIHHRPFGRRSETPRTSNYSMKMPADGTNYERVFKIDY
jgi:hypothetical protein